MRTRGVLAVIAVLAMATMVGAAEPKLETDDEKTLYALGLMLSRNLGVFNLSEAELAPLQAGLRDGVLKKDPKVNLQEVQPKIQQFGQKRSEAVAAGEKKTGAEFVEKTTKEPGVKKLTSGVLYKETQAGTGATPKATDQVKVHYTGKLIDGTVFDSSVQRGQPATFPLSGVVKCWTEGVQQMKVGGKAQLVCPSETAYGDRGSPPTIKPGSTLVFDVELLDIVTPTASPSPAK